MDIYGLPQPLMGTELITVQQEQNGQMATCSMPLSELLTYVTANAPELWIATLPTTLPTKAGAPWNNAGLLSIS